MNMNAKRPLSVTIVAILYLAVGIAYLAVGIAGFIGHGWEALRATHFPPDAIAIEITEFFAIIAGAFLLRGQNWARWLAVAWMAFHVAISVSHSLRELAIHAVFLVLITWILFRSGATRYFCKAEANAT